jgi:hypothetical protein
MKRHTWLHGHSSDRVANADDSIKVVKRNFQVLCFHF